MSALRALPAHRMSLEPAVQRAFKKFATAGPSRTATTMAYLPHDHSPSFDIQIFDIFDAPTKLGESSSLLARTAQAHSTSARPSKVLSTSAFNGPTVRKIKPLPQPIIFDGPARPRRLASMSYRAGRSRPATTVRAKTVVDSPKSVSTLPPPIVFDGPSRIRPYNRNTFDGHNNEKFSSPIILALLAATGALVLSQYDGHERLRRLVRQNLIAWSRLIR
ncbi:hypothetical protein K474DRAFT_1517660 [Panus rudis PR-1116 ss-1]|nr:hypothetical protein K474DRAFT_1517660 [Panus rudis PR-1116 ss-1]